MLLDGAPVRSLALDNGVENVRYEELGITTYFCHPYSSWEKGQVEQGIGMMRGYIPKRADLKGYSPQYIHAMVDAINALLMKCLGYRTPDEVFEEQSTLFLNQ